MICYKRYTGKLLPQKTAEQPRWVQWTHHSEGKTHCEERKALKTCEKLMEQLFQRLNKEDYELVQELQAQTAIAQCEENESYFKYGFSAGLIVQQEAHEQVQQKKEK